MKGALDLKSVPATRVRASLLAAGLLHYARSGT
jgi:hypothetical protein